MDRRLPHTEISVVIPVYKSASMLPAVVDAIRDVLNREAPASFEIVLVNDASPDESWNVIRQLAAQDGRVKGISLRRNAGQHNAIMAGLSVAGGTYIVLMDDDLQHPPAAIPQLIFELKAGSDVCYTSYIDRQHALWKKIGSAFNDRVASFLLKKPKGLYLSSFKAMRYEIAREMLKYDGPFAYIDALILDVTRSISVVDVKHGARLHGEGNYNLRRSLSLWLKAATSSSVYPLRFATLLGVVISAVSFIGAIWVVINKLIDPSIPAGWSSLMVVTCLVAGIQLVALGIIGEYVGRAFVTINHRPQYVIRESTWFDL